MAAWLPVSHTSASCSLPCSPAGCYSWSAVRCKKKKEKRAHARTTHTHSHTHTVCSRWSHFFFFKKTWNATSSYPQSGQVDFVQTPSWRVTRHDGEHKKPLSVARYPERAFAVTTVWSSVLLSLYRPLSLFSTQWCLDKIITVPVLVSSGTCLWPGAQN